MRKILSIFIALICGVSQAQTFTVNNLQINGATTATTPIQSSAGGTGSAFFNATGGTATRVYTFPDAAATILYSGGALGTPSAGVATNLTGTASGLTAGNVTTNANLTGPVTSVGNATTIGAAQVTLNNLATEATNTVVGNATSGTASPTALAVGTCSTSSSALIWTTNTGFGCNTSVNAATLGGATFASPGTIGSTAANTGAFTTLSASSTVSGTGFSTYLASPPAIGGTTPASGKFTTLQATSTISPSSTAGIVGTITNDNANVGSVGEYITNTTSATSVSNNVAANVASLVNLPAGDYDITGIIATHPAGTTVVSGSVQGVSTTSATLGAFGTYTQLNFTDPTGTGNIVSAPVVRISLSATTTVFLVAQISFTVSTCTVDGFIRARRVR
jgi:hypothetical protein